jgi:hypothetical protein
MKVSLIMFYDDVIKDYGNINYEINKKYCEKNNFEIIFSNKKKYINIHSAWERLLLLLDNITKFDYLIWIDADAYFYYDAQNIVELINHNTHTNFIFSNDIGNGNINTGIFIVKNTQYCIDFLHEWAYNDDLYKNNPHNVWWDQGVLIDMFNKNILNIQQNCIIFDYGVLQHFYDNDRLQKTFVHHLAGRNKQTRYETSRNYFNNIFSIKYHLSMQYDGNLVIYDNFNIPKWASNTVTGRHEDYNLIWQDDGNLVIYDIHKKPIWATNTWDKGVHPKRMDFDSNNGILRIIDANNDILFSSQ